MYPCFYLQKVDILTLKIDPILRLKRLKKRPKFSPRRLDTRQNLYNKKCSKISPQKPDFFDPKNQVFRPRNRSIDFESSKIDPIFEPSKMTPFLTINKTARKQHPLKRENLPKWQNFRLSITENFGFCVHTLHIFTFCTFLCTSENVCVHANTKSTRFCAQKSTRFLRPLKPPKVHP